MNIVYKVKEGTDLNEFAKLGYDIIPDSGICIFKVIEQPFDGELVQGVIKNIYTNKKWVNKFYKPYAPVLKEKLGLKYFNNGEIDFTDKFKEILTNWIIQIEMTEDGWLGFTSMDQFDTNVYYNKTYLDEYCGEEIKTLLEKDLIEEFYIPDDNEEIYEA